jgi:hypothetical protein
MTRGGCSRLDELRLGKGGGDARRLCVAISPADEQRARGSTRDPGAQVEQACPVVERYDDTVNRSQAFLQDPFGAVRELTELC